MPALGTDGRRNSLARFARDQLKGHERHGHLNRDQLRKCRDIVDESRKPPRSPLELLKALGSADCPPDTPPSPDLCRECRRALGVSQGEMAWRLGAGNRRSAIYRRAEHGLRTLNRPERLLLRREVERLLVEADSRKGAGRIGSHDRAETEAGDYFSRGG